MKKLLLILITFISSFSAAQTTDDLFREGNELYKKGDYNAALEKYQKITEQGFISADLYYNMANSYYKLDKIAPSVLFYKRALKIDPSMEDAAFNLKMARQRTVDNIKKLPETFMSSLWRKLTSIMSLKSWAVFSVVLAFVSSLSFILYYFGKDPVFKRFNFVVSMLSITIMILSVLVAHKTYNWQQNNREAVIMTENTYIKVAPNENSDDSFILHEGTELLVVDEVGSWYRIKLQDGKIGWISKEDIVFV